MVGLSMDLQLKHMFLRDCYSKTYDELLFRIRHRDAWIKVQLVAQIVLFATSSGLKIHLVDSAVPIPNALSFCLPVSFVILMLFLVEERTVGHLSRYIGHISREEQKLNPGHEIPTFDATLGTVSFFTSTERFRFGSQITVFLLIPVMLWFYKYMQPPQFPELSFDVAVNAPLIAIILWQLASAHMARNEWDRKANPVESTTAIKPA
jgi:hypothetical protein